MDSIFTLDQTATSRKFKALSPLERLGRTSKADLSLLGRDLARLTETRPFGAAFGGQRADRSPFIDWDDVNKSFDSIQASDIRGDTDTHDTRTEAQWVAQRANFTRYYLTENRGLQSAVWCMIDNHNFRATPQQWQHWLEAWGLDKHATQQDRRQSVGSSTWLRPRDLPRYISDAVREYLDLKASPDSPRGNQVPGLPRSSSFKRQQAEKSERSTSRSQQAKKGRAYRPADTFFFGDLLPSRDEGAKINMAAHSLTFDSPLSTMFMHYTISEDRSGDSEAVKAAILSRLGEPRQRSAPKKKISNGRATAFGDVEYNFEQLRIPSAKAYAQRTLDAMQRTQAL